MSAKNTTTAEKKSAVTVTDPEVDARVREKLVIARVTLLIKQPFFGNMATRLILVNADNWLPTAATDGRYFYYNSEFVDKLRTREVEFLFGHEVLHNVYAHMARRDSRDPMLFNIAADYCVNADLINSGIGEKITTVGCLYDTKYEGWSAEEVYDDLLPQWEKQTAEMQKLIQEVLDEHLDENNPGDEGDDEGDEPGKNGPARMSEEERRALKDEVRDAMMQAAAAAQGAGSIPGGVKRLINELTEPKMNWRQIIQQQIQSLVKYDYSWMRMNRRGWHMDAIFPGSDLANTIDVSIAIDTSGSMSEKMLADILSEVGGIMQAFDDFKLTVWMFDTAVYNHKVFTPENIDELSEYALMGGGGTDFMVNWSDMRERDHQPKLFLFFTDMYPCGEWGDPDYCDTIFIDIANTGREAPFGITCKYTER